jgi:hypothetical protein
MIVNWADVFDLELASALGALGKKLADPPIPRRVKNDLETATWADTERLIKLTLPEVFIELPEISEADAADLEETLKHHEVQGALQALLAARLTDAPESDAAKAREAVRLALGGTKRNRSTRRRSTTKPDPADGPLATFLSEYFDDKICAIVARLEGHIQFEGLAQIRAEAYNSRIVALLGTLVDLVESLSHPGRYSQEEHEILDRYRRQVQERHGKIEPPDFERRKRVPISQIYVPTMIARNGPEYLRKNSIAQEPTLSVWELMKRVDRTVLLGDPGAGKTTAANVLVNQFASDPAQRIPVLVTLREYAASTPLPWSVAEHIEQNLRTMYLCPITSGLVERLLYTGRATVVFDGLDELIDTSRRRLVSEMIEQFCTAYPLVPVLVTSRAVGYDEARLDDSLFTCYRLGGFHEADVSEYVKKWFAVQDRLTHAEAALEARAFLKESSSAFELQSNPLLLALMCILYRGAGSLPRDKAGIYARCAELLFGKWDEQRHIRHALRAADFVEEAIRHLAWWMFSNEESLAAVTETALTEQAAEFLQGRAFESESSARSAAKEFVEFCRGRMWVFSDAGTTANGEKLYAFTHRTFLEYFAAAHMAAVSDSPEDLAGFLSSRVTVGQWDVVGELAVQIKGRTNDRGADRIYSALIASESDLDKNTRLLKFLAQCLDSARPSPANARKVIQAALTCNSPDNYSAHPFGFVLRNGSSYTEIIAEEITKRIIELAIDVPNRPVDSLEDFRAIGMFFKHSSRMPLIKASRHEAAPKIASLLALADSSRETHNRKDDFIGLAVVIAISWELSEGDVKRLFSIADLAKGTEFESRFRSWLKGKINFVQFVTEHP